jgi:HD-GYP domain-containing protein (c-di-GMP phosphodiesterase class II)
VKPGTSDPFAITSPTSLGREGAFSVRLTEVFETLATRFRPAGLFLAILDGQGRVLAHDEAADANIRDRALAVLRSSAGPRLALLARSDRAVTADPGLTPGARAAVFLTPQPNSLAIAAVSFHEAGLNGVPDHLLLPITETARGTLRDLLAARTDGDQLLGVTSQLADTYEELSLLYQVTGAMRLNHSPDDFFRTLCIDLRTVLGAGVVGAALRPGRSRQSSLVVEGALPIDIARLSRFVDETMEQLIDASTPLVCNDLASSSLLSFLSPDVRQLLAVPLWRDQHMLGFIFAIEKERGLFDSVDAKLVASVAMSGAVYMENSLYLEDMRGLMMGLLHSLSSAIDAKDSYTCGHSQRVASLARLIALHSGADADSAERIYISGLLHDLGKIGVPESVLQKTGRLTPEEFEQMKQHPRIGARILEGIQQLQDVIPGVLHHHERFDGKGYPAGLAGTDIPLMGRILCLADSFDAMTTNRTYRAGMPHDAALAEIARCAGAQFDPDLAHLFVNLGLPRIHDSLASAHLRRPPQHASPAPAFITQAA